MQMVIRLYCIKAYRAEAGLSQRLKIAHGTLAVEFILVSAAFVGPKTICYSSLTLPSLLTLIARCSQELQQI